MPRTTLHAGSALLTTGAVLLTATATASAAPFNPPPGSPVRVERVNGPNAMTVVGKQASVGLRGEFDAPASGTTTAQVRLVRNGKQVFERDVPLTIDGETATLRMPIHTRDVGVYRVGVRVDGRLVGKPVEFNALPRTLTPGSSRATIAIAQEALASKAYVVGTKGRLDGRTQRAITAFRKRMGLPRTTRWDSGVATRLARGDGAFKVRFPGHGRHIEADISKQILALIGAGGKVERIYPTSSGAPATPTILGSFSVYRKDYGTNAKGMVHSSYFIRGYAIHGFASVPTYNASHGCLRVPVPDAMSIFRWVRYGTRVDTYR